MPRPDEAPIVVLTPPGGGDGVLVEALSLAAGVSRPAPGAPPFPEALPRFRLADGRSTHRLDAADARGRGVGREASRAMRASLDGPGRPLLTGLRLALRIPFVASVLPGARFVLVHRELRTALQIALDGWRSQEVVSAPELEGWTGPPWSLPLVPGWRDLAGLELGEIVGRQWAEIARTALDDLQQLESGAWCVVDRTALLEDPRAELRRVCAFLGLTYDQALLTPIEAARRSTALRPPPPGSPDLDAALAAAADTERRLRDVIAGDGAARAPQVAGAASPAVTLGSRASGSLSRTLGQLGGSLLIAAPQAETLACVRDRGGVVNTHFRSFDRPTALAVAPGRFALATRTEVWDFRDVPAAAPDPRHDACFVPRGRHLTGPAGVEDIAFAGDELWLACSELSCLATLDDEHSVVPRWAPPFAGGAGPGDRCHLNGLAVRDGRIAYATALGVSDTPGGWRDGLATGGVLIDVASSEIVASGLSVPSSPRWHDDRLFVLEGGKGTLGVADPASGRVEDVVELPGFARGMTIAGHLAFVGLSQLRDPGEFRGLEVTRRLPERRSGVWAVDLRRGEIAGFLRFEDAVQEVAGVALLPRRWPEIADPASPDAGSAFALPR